MLSPPSQQAPYTQKDHFSISTLWERWEAREPVGNNRTGKQMESRGPQPLLGTRLHSRRWAAGEWAKLHLPIPITRVTAWTDAPPPQFPTSVEKLSYTKPVPGAKTIGDRCSRLSMPGIINHGSWFNAKAKQFCAIQYDPHCFLDEM